MREWCAHVRRVPRVPTGKSNVQSELRNVPQRTFEGHTRIGHAEVREYACAQIQDRDRAGWTP